MNAPDPTNDQVSFRAIRKDYPTGDGVHTVFDGLSLDVRRGEFISLVGSSGCGKTTLLNMLAGFVQPDAGDVLFEGARVTGPSRERGIVFQQYAVFPWLTVRQNIEFPMKLEAAPRRSAQEIDALVSGYIAQVGLERFADAYPKMLSGGMKQRLAIARAYAADPTILLMDEPFAALDAQSRERMQDLLLNITRSAGRTVVFVTHSIEEALYLSDRVVVLGGRPSVVRRLVEVPLGASRNREDRLSAQMLQMRRQIEDTIDDAEAGQGA